MRIQALLRALSAIAVLVALTDAAADRTDVTGAWSGKIQGMLTLVLHVQRGATGYTATLDSPDQGAMGMPIDRLSVTGDSLRFEMRALRAGYLARINAAGDSLEGLWSQGGMSLPLVLTRGAPAPTRPSQEAWPPYPYDTVAVSVPNQAAGMTLAGTLTLPRGKGPFPAAVLITGSGPEDRDETIFGHRPFRVLADHLTRRGVAVLRLDDRGVGQSTGTFAGATSEDFASDALAAVQFLRVRKDVAKIGLIGHSEGGLIAPMVANRSHEVSFVVLMAGPALRGDSILTLQSARLRSAIGVSDQALAAEQEASRRVYTAAARGDSAGVAAATRELVRLQLAALPEAQRQAAGDPESIAASAVLQFWSPWMRFFIAYDPTPALARLTVPVLAINGSKDLQVPAPENLPAMRAALGDNHDATVKELPGLNHLFQTANTGSVAEYARIDETIAPLALRTISDWITAHTGTKR